MMLKQVSVEEVLTVIDRCVDVEFFGFEEKPGQKAQPNEPGMPLNRRQRRARKKQAQATAK